MYEIGKFMVYSTLVVYSKLLLLTSYKFTVSLTLDSLQQIVVTFTSHRPIIVWLLQARLSLERLACETRLISKLWHFSLLTVCFSANQWAITLFHCQDCGQSVLQPISELLHFFHCGQSVLQPISELLHFFALFSYMYKKDVLQHYYLLHCCSYFWQCTIELTEFDCCCK